MAGFREFRPGEVWFYYNPNTSKDLERKKELGAITSRPVVIVQDAFYQEWSDSITVCPMTSSDRRTGIHVDTTIFADGTMIEGGTILPYCFYTIKVKYLHPMASDSKAEHLKCISLAPETFAELKRAIAYHLGLSTEIPEYIRAWKHLDDFTRDVVIKSARIAIDDFENNVRAYAPRLIQSPDGTVEVENHIISTANRMNPARTEFVYPTNSYPKMVPTQDNSRSDADPINASELHLAELLVQQQFRKAHRRTDSILFMPLESMPVESLEEIQRIIENDLEPNQASRVYPGSKVLADVQYKDARDVLTHSEIQQICGMSISEIVKNTGAGSSSTASRIRMSLKEIVENPSNESHDSDVENFSYSTVSPCMKRARLRRTASARLAMFGCTKEELVEIFSISPDQFTIRFPQLTSHAYHSFRKDISLMYPNDVSSNPGQIQSEMESSFDRASSIEFDRHYKLWETLSIAELNEVASTSKRNLPSMAKKYSLGRQAFNVLREDAISVLRQDPEFIQPEVDMVRASDVCVRLATGAKIESLTLYDILSFCRLNTNDIIKTYTNCRSPNVPSKSNITALKSRLRRQILIKTK